MAINVNTKTVTSKIQSDTMAPIPAVMGVPFFCERFDVTPVTKKVEIKQGQKA